MNDTIEMKLAKEPFNQIKNGEKTVEIRLFDEKRRRIKIGDKIVFSNLNDLSEYLIATVAALHRFNSFIELFLSDLFIKTGSGEMTANEAAESMYLFYTKEQEEKFGVLGIEICDIVSGK